MARCYIGKKVCWVETEYTSMRWDFNKEQGKWLCDNGDTETEWDLDLIKDVINNEMEC